MTMTRTKLTLTLTTLALAGLLSVACGGPEEVTAPTGNDPLILTPAAPIAGPVTLVGSLQSACKGHPGESDGANDSYAGSLKLTLLADGSLEIVHVDVEANCAAKLASKVKVTPPAAGNPGAIEVEEWVTNPDQAADCICRFDVKTTVAGLAAGTYEVTAIGPAKELAGPASLTIPAPLLATKQSACKKGVTNSTTSLGAVKATTQGSGLLVEHADVTANCAAKLAMRATVTAPAGGTPGSILIEEVVTNPEQSANCVCTYDLSTTVAGLAPGAYELTVKDPDGQTTGPLAVQVP